MISNDKVKEWKSNLKRIKSFPRGDVFTCQAVFYLACLLDDLITELSEDDKK